MSGNDFLPALLFFDPNNAPEMLKQFPQATLMRLNRTVQAVLSRGTSLPPAVADDEPAWNRWEVHCAFTEDKLGNKCDNLIGLKLE